MNKFLHFNVVLNPSMSVKQRKKYQSRTAVVQPLSAKEVKDIAEGFLATTADATLVQLNVGVTFLSLKDRYSKKEGRDEATKKMTTVILEVSAVHITKAHVFVQLVELKGITLMLRLNKSTGYSTVTGSLTIGA